jgi:hypothetical protein
MKNKLFGIDIRKYRGDETEVIFWRDDNQNPGECTRVCIPVHTESTYNRLWRQLPPANTSYVAIHPRPHYLSINYLLKVDK